MRVSFFSNFQQPCGIADYSTQMVEELAKLVDVNVVKSPLPSKDIYPLYSYPYYAGKFHQCARQVNDADICHIQHDYSFWGGLRPLRNLFPHFASAIKVPVVMTAHEILKQPYKMANFQGALHWLSLCFSTYSRSYSDLVNSGIYQWADNTIVHTLQHREMLEGRGVSPEKITVISHGIPSFDAGTINPDELLTGLGIAGKRLMTIIGFISPRKGYEQVVGILSDCPSDLVLVIAGGCRTDAEKIYLSDLRNYIDHCGLSKRVLITGYLEPVTLYALVKASSLVLAPFKEVAGSGTLSIALALGRPIIASNLASLVELNTATRSMLLFAADDSKDLLAKIKLLLNDDALLLELSAAALKYAAINSMRAVAKRTVALYDQILTARSMVSAIK